MTTAIVLATLLLVAAAPVASAFQGIQAVPADVLVVDRGITDPAGPLDLVLFVRLLTPLRVLEITARAAKHPAFPAALFHDKDVTVRLTLPTGIVLEAGRLTWSGELHADDVAEVRATVRVLGDLDGAIEASVIGHGGGGRVDADVERFYVAARGDAIRVSRDPITGDRQPSRPGASTR